MIVKTCFDKNYKYEKIFLNIYAVNISKNITVSCCKIEGFRYSTHVSYCTGYYPTRSTVGYFFEKMMNPGMMNLVIPDSDAGVGEERGYPGTF